MFPRCPQLVHGQSFFRHSVHLPFGMLTRKSLIVFVQCEHWTHTSTELPCGGNRTNSLCATVLIRRVFLLKSRPSVDGQLMLLPLLMIHLISLHLSWGPVQTPDTACPLYVAPEPVAKASVNTTACLDTCSGARTNARSRQRQRHPTMFDIAESIEQLLDGHVPTRRT